MKVNDNPMPNHNNKVLFNSFEIKVGKFSLYSLGSMVMVRLKYMQCAKTQSLCDKVHNLPKQAARESEHVKNKVLMLHPRKRKTKGKVDRMWLRMEPAVLWQRKYDRRDGALEL